MVRRGNRATGPVSANNTSSTLSSSGSSHHELQWKPLCPQSANSGDTSLAKSAKSSDSANSSPGSRHSTSPPIGKKGNGNGGKSARSSSNWRARGAGGGRNSAAESKFTITSEDFPALPGARGGNGGTPQSTLSKNAKKERDNGKQLNADLVTTDDSGVSSVSRGHTPTDPIGSSNSRATSTTGKFVKNDFEGKKKSAPGSQSAAEYTKKKNLSPMKERPPRGGVKHGRITVHQPITSASPKKKTINANAATTAPSFMKLSKVGQKIPERRGGQRANNQTPPSVGSTSPTNDDKENKPKKGTEFLSTELEPVVNIIPAKESENDRLKVKEEVLTEPPAQQMTIENSVFQTNLAPSHCIFHPSDISKINLGPDGEMSNIPPTMLTDQFGMAAMLPILDIVKNRSVNVNNANLTKEQLREKINNENIEMTTIGFDLNELGVPMKTQDISQKTVWETFAGPFGNQPLLPTNMGLSSNQVPNVYYTARTLQSSFDMLHNIPEKFGLHELFYIFYNLPKELWQLNAARELQYRGWRFNIKERLWVHKKLGEPEEFGKTVTAPQNSFTQPGANQEDVMVGSFEIYDAEKARICSAEKVLRRSDFEVPAWEQKVPDTYQKVLSQMFPKEMLWGPREDRKQFGFMQGMSGMLPNVSGRSKLANLVIPKTQQSSDRRLLSFADSPDITPNFENPFGNLPPATTAEDLCRQQMYAMILQKMQMHQKQQYHQQLSSASNQSKMTPSSFSSSNYFQS